MTLAELITFTVATGLVDAYCRGRHKRRDDTLKPGVQEVPTVAARILANPEQIQVREQIGPYSMLRGLGSTASLSLSWLSLIATARGLFRGKWGVPGCLLQHESRRLRSMFYRLHPQEPIRWSDLLNGSIYQYMIENDLPLSRLDWEVAGRELSQPLIELAMRFGTPDDNAIYLDWHKADAIYGVEQAEEAHASLEQIKEMYPEINTQEQWDEMDSLSRAIVEERRTEYQALLEAPVRENLKELWNSLGGHYQG